MISSLVAKATLGTVIACGGLTGAAHSTNVNNATPLKVEAKAPAKAGIAQQPVKVKSQNEVKNIALKHTPGTVKKVDKTGHDYKITILGADHQEHVYQVNEQTGACASISK